MKKTFRATKKQGGEVVIIEWVDAAIHGSETFTKEEAESLHLIKGVAVGVLVKDSPDSITIAMDYFPEEDTYRTVQTYPKSGITKTRMI